MGTSQAITPKYIVRASFEVEGVVEKSDVIGALFGQTEGLFGPDLDLHELQKSGRIGRIEIEMETKKDKTNGMIVIPSSLDKTLTALIAAAVENVDRVGPCAAKVILEKIDDFREQRRETIIERAKEILQQWTVETTSTIDHVTEEIYSSAKPPDIVPFGPDKLAAGPDVEKSSGIIVVEGRADVTNLLRSGVKNAVACQGTSIPDSLAKLIKGKEITVLLDGDRGGDIILEALLQTTNVQFIARAPRGMEVEELTPKQVLKVLSEKVPIDKLMEERNKPVKKTVSAPEKVAPDKIVTEKVFTIASTLKGTLEAVILDEKLEQTERVPVSELAVKLQQVNAGHTLIFDGIITQRIVDIAADKGLKRIIGDRISGLTKRPMNVQLLTIGEITAEEVKNNAQA
ncbi:DNA primase DnaG [Candidatus Bathyarchaeota archaeon]|nr:DNA primase DnaG [Candidatus Bathyarchaeota archaeon]